jgi:DNA (cytosine-5)-methyltransferase 1
VLVLSIFPGRDIIGKAFKQEGFCVVTAGDKIIGNLIGNFHAIPNVFKGVIGCPPCKIHSMAIWGNKATEPDLTPEFERIIREAQPDWFIFENVPRTTKPKIEKYINTEIVVNALDYGAKQSRKRLIIFGSKTPKNFQIQKVPKGDVCKDYFPCVTATEHKYYGHPADNRRSGRKVKRQLTLQEVISLMGLNPETEQHIITSKFLTKEGKYQIYGNGLEFHQALAIAKAVRKLFPKTE